MTPEGLATGNVSVKKKGWLSMPSFLKRKTVVQKEVELMNKESEVDISSRGIAQNQWFSSKVYLKRMEFKGESSLYNFMKKNGPIPFFPLPEMGRIGTYWYEEIEELSRIARFVNKLPDLQKAFNDAISAINKLGYAMNPLDTIYKVGGKTRTHAAMIQRLLTALEIVRTRRKEINVIITGVKSEHESEGIASDNQSEPKVKEYVVPKVYVLVRRILSDIPNMVEQAVDQLTLFEWADKVSELLVVNQKTTLHFLTGGMTEKKIQIPIPGFGHALMTLAAIAKLNSNAEPSFGPLMNKLKDENLDAKDGLVHKFVRKVEDSSVECIEKNLQKFMGWLNDFSDEKASDEKLLAIKC